MANKQNEGNEKIDLNCEIESKICSLEEKINALNGKFYTYEKDNEGNFYAVVNGTKLDVPIKSPEDLIEALKTIQYMLDVYIKAGYMGKIYAKESYFTRGDKISIIDLIVDNRKIFLDTTFLTGETIQKVFGVKDTRNKMETKKIANFLNTVLGYNQLKERKWSNAKTENKES